MSVTLIFEGPTRHDSLGIAHGTTFDNEAHLSSGWNDVVRAYRSAEIGFGGLSAQAGKWPIIRDQRLRECNYGDLTQKHGEIIDAEKPQRISTPFPNGESYAQTTARMKSFLDDLKRDYDGKRVMVIGHRPSGESADSATQYGIENYVNGVPLQKLVATHFKWQKGWGYEVK